MFHGGLWGGWQYQVAAQPAEDTLAFGYGGYQEARGSGIRCADGSGAHHVLAAARQGLCCYHRVATSNCRCSKWLG